MRLSFAIVLCLALGAGQALAHYGKALELKPEHRGANEYLGELYLDLGRMRSQKCRPIETCSQATPTTATCLTPRTGLNTK